MIVLEVLGDLHKYLMEHYAKYMRYLYMSLGFGFMYFLMITMSSSDIKYYYNNITDMLYTDEYQVTHVVKDKKEVWTGVTLEIKKEKTQFILTLKDGSIKKVSFKSMEAINKNNFILDEISNIKENGI